MWVGPGLRNRSLWEAHAPSASQPTPVYRFSPVKALLFSQPHMGEICRDGFQEGACCVAVEMLVNFSVSTESRASCTYHIRQWEGRRECLSLGTQLRGGCLLRFLSAKAWEISVTQAVVLADRPFGQVWAEHQ